MFTVKDGLKLGLGLIIVYDLYGSIKVLLMRTSKVLDKKLEEAEKAKYEETFSTN